MESNMGHEMEMEAGLVEELLGVEHKGLGLRGFYYFDIRTIRGQYC